jgi:hypothetical protein
MIVLVFVVGTVITEWMLSVCENKRKMQHTTPYTNSSSIKKRNAHCQFSPQSQIMLVLESVSDRRINRGTNERKRTTQADEEPE